MGGEGGYTHDRALPAVIDPSPNSPAPQSRGAKPSTVDDTIGTNGRSTKTSTVAEARRRLEAEALPSVEAQVTLRDNAKDEAVRLRAATEILSRAVPPEPQTSVVVHASLDEAAAYLARLLGDDPEGPGSAAVAAISPSPPSSNGGVLDVEVFDP